MTASGEVNERFTAWLADRVGDDGLRIEGVENVEFGHSAEMLALTIAAGGSRRDVIVRLRPRPPALLEPYDLRRQFEILQALAPTAVRVPPVLWLEESGDVLGRPFLVMDRVPGDVYEMKAPDAEPDRIRKMCHGMADQLAAIHLVDLDSVGLGRLDDGAGHLDRELDHWAGEMHRVQRGPLPALERLLRALRDTKPEAHSQVTLVHGDAKPGNFAFVDDDVSAVFDWEMTTIGDPLTDIGWMELLWMQPVGITSHPAAPTFDEFLARYTQASGITPQNRPWYRAVNAYKMAVICLIGGMLFDNGLSNDLKLAVAASGVEVLTVLGLSDLGITEHFEPGPIGVRQERVHAVRSRSGTTS